MKRIHPRLAGAIFIVIYISIGIIISVIIKKNLFESKLAIVIGLIGITIINLLFTNKYYDKIVEEKKEEEEFFRKAKENLDKLSTGEK